MLVGIQNTYEQGRISRYGAYAKPVGRRVFLSGRSDLSASNSECEQAAVAQCDCSLVYCIYIGLRVRENDIYLL